MRHKFCAYRGSYIAEKLKEVLEEQMTNESQYGIHDYVDIAVHNVNKNNVCCKCTATYELRYPNALLVVMMLITMILILIPITD